MKGIILEAPSVLDESSAKQNKESWASLPTIKPDYSREYAYAKRSHWKLFEGLDVEL